MNKVLLGRTGYNISRVGLGTVQFGVDYGFTKKKSQDIVDEILSCAYSMNINFIDTAREYGDSERKIGNYISQNKNNFIIATKLKKISEIRNLDYRNLKYSIYNSVEESMCNLKIQKIDLLQLHQTDYFLINNYDFWRVIRQLKEEKIIGGFGISVYEQDETSLLLKNYYDVIDFFQIPYNIFDRRFSELESSFKEYSIGIISRSTFLKGVIPCTLNEIPRGLEKLVNYKIKLNNISESLSMKVEEIALLFVYYSSLITSTILGVNSSAELKKNINIVDNYNNILENVDFSDLDVSDLNLIDPRKWSNF